MTHLPGQLRQPGVVFPRRLADELLQRLAFLVVEVGDRFDVLVRQVGDQARDIRLGMLRLLAPLEPFDEGEGVVLTVQERQVEAPAGVADPQARAARVGCGPDLPDWTAWDTRLAGAWAGVAGVARVRA